MRSVLKAFYLVAGRKVATKGVPQIVNRKPVARTVKKVGPASYDRQPGDLSSQEMEVNFSGRIVVRRRGASIEPVKVYK